MKNDTHDYIVTDDYIIDRETDRDVSVSFIYVIDMLVLNKLLGKECA